ncbi:MAG TPA: extensin family protein [Polyangia bacterium]
MPRVLAALLAALAACAPAPALVVPDEPVVPPALPEAEPARAVVRILPEESELDPHLEEGPGPEEPGPPPAGAPLGTRLGLLGPDRCLAGLRAAGVRFRREPDPVDDVVTPIRLTGPVGGVTYRGLSRDPASPYAILDCRLALALTELSAILQAHGIVEVIHYSMHRPEHNGRGVDSGGSTGHRGGMAIDAAIFRRADGSTLNVLRDFRGRRGAPPCGRRAPPAPTEPARVLRDIVCRAQERGLFHVLLTPNYDHAHRNHYHMEVRPDGVTWLYVH